MSASGREYTTLESPVKPLAGPAGLSPARAMAVGEG